MEAALVHTEEMMGLVIKIYLDDHCDDSNNPMEYEKVCELWHAHQRYKFGSGRMDWDDLEALIEEPGIYYMPVYMYSHSGVTLASTPFGNPWDSGKVGYAIIREENAKKCWGWETIGKKEEEVIQKALSNFIQVMAWWMEGSVYGFVVEDDENNVVDSCWGFLGEYTYALNEARECVKHFAPKLENKFMGEGI